MDDAGPQSLFVVGTWSSNGPYSGSIIQLETPQVDASSSANTPVLPTQSEFLAHIPHLSQAHIPHLSQARRSISLVVSLPPASSTEDLYMLPDWNFQHKNIKKDEDSTLPGFIFNLGTKKCKIIKPPLAPKYMGHAVTLGDHIYFLAQPEWEGCFWPEPRFECYDTLSQKWEERAPIPLYRGGAGFIQGTAVLDDTILFYMKGSEGSIMKAYNVGRKRWYPVKVLNDLCYNIVGVAVVLNKIIYSLSMDCDSVVAIELIKSREEDGDLVFTCNLHKEYEVPGMEQIEFEHDSESYRWTHHLVHLGKYNFCVVRSCNLWGLNRFHQYIQLTNIELREKESIVTNICVHEFKLPGHGQFIISHCFSMPLKRKTTNALKQVKGFLKFNPEQEAEIVTLPPELLPFQDKYSSQANIIDKQGGSVSQSSQSRDDADTKTPQVQEVVPKKSSASVVTGNQSLNDATKASTLGNGHSICVTNLPHNAKFGQFFSRLKEFGPFENFDFRIDPDNPSGSYVDVEFVSATSKQNAIKASPIKIGGCLVVIEEKRGTGLTQGRSSSGYQSLNHATKASTLGDGGESGSSHTFEEGHSIWVTNVPRDANLQPQLYNRLESFGLIKNIVCQVDPDNTNDLLVHVEFESATSKQKAIKASVIKVGGRKAVIEEKRGTGLTQGGSVSQSSQSRDDADTKTPRVQEDVPKKSSASMVAAKSNVPSKVSTVTGHQSFNYYATKASIIDDGHSIWITNLPPDPNLIKLRKGLERFGPIKDYFLYMNFKNTSESYAYVEFESATSKQDAIQTSLLEIGNHIAVIVETRGTGGLTQGDSNRSSSKTSRNKLKKKHGKDSRSKTAREGLPRIIPLESF